MRKVVLFYIARIVVAIMSDMVVNRMIVWVSVRARLWVILRWLICEVVMFSFSRMMSLMVRF